MTKIKFNVSLTTDCAVTLADVTGFTDTNTTGFILESAGTIPLDSYKLSSGYFLDIITYNKYNRQPIVVLTGALSNTPTAEVLPVYTDNFPAISYALSQDSIYTLHRYFIMSDVFYNSQLSTDRFDGKIVYYTDGIDIYKVTEGVANKITSAAFVLEDQELSTNLHTSNTFVSTCYTNKCYYTLMQKILLDQDCMDCSKLDNATVKYMDLMYMSLEVIKYLKDLGTISEIQRVIESLDTCGGVCGPIVKTNSNCGCNG